MHLKGDYFIRPEYKVLPQMLTVHLDEVESYC